MALAQWWQGRRLEELTRGTVVPPPTALDYGWQQLIGLFGEHEPGAEGPRQRRSRLPPNCRSPAWCMLLADPKLRSSVVSRMREVGVMRKSGRRRWTVLVAVGLFVATMGSGLPSAAGAAAPEALIEEEAWPDSLVRDYLAAYPQLSPAEVRARLDGLEARKTLAQQWAEMMPKTFAGTWYDFPGDVLHVGTTAPQQRGAIHQDAGMRGTRVEVHDVAHSLVALEETRAAIESGELLPELRDRSQIRMDLASNSVTIGLGLALSVASLPPGVRVVEKVAEEPGVPAACISRYNCGAPLRSGVNVGTWAGGRTDNGCSIGFTARASDGSRWALTAGHCIPQSHVDSGRLWGHGQQYIGPPRQRGDGGQVDVARIRMDNPYWRQVGGGYMYATPTRTVDVDLAIVSRATIEVNDPVCFNGRSYLPGDDNCGRVTTAYGYRDMPRVVGVKVCSGDSGGAAYLIYGGQRWAYGLISSTSQRPIGGCTLNDGQVNFSPLPAINAWFDARSAATIRVETR